LLEGGGNLPRENHSMRILITNDDGVY